MITKCVLTASILGVLVSSASIFTPEARAVTISAVHANAVINAKEADYQAELYREAHSNPLSRKSYRILKVALARKAAREEAELAAYEKFKIDLAVAMAEASASKTYITPAPAAPAQPAPQESSAPFSDAPPLGTTGASSGSTSGSTAAQEPGGTSSTLERLHRYPDKFFAKRAREIGANDEQARTAATVQDRSEEAATSSFQAEPAREPEPGYLGAPVFSPYGGGYRGGYGYPGGYGGYPGYAPYGGFGYPYGGMQFRTP